LKKQHNTIHEEKRVGVPPIDSVGMICFIGDYVMFCRTNRIKIGFVYEYDEKLPDYFLLKTFDSGTSHSKANKQKKLYKTLRTPDVRSIIKIPPFLAKQLLDDDELFDKIDKARSACIEETQS
jgi:hypothetical protein